MKSNFDFLQTEFPVLSTFGCQAEKYCFSDPNSCLMKLGMIGESIVNLMFTYDRIQLPYDNTAVTRIDTLQREGLLTRDLTDILHALRKARNKAVHENYDSESECKILLQMAYSLCEWFMQTYGDWNYQHHDFIMPELENKRVSVTQEEKAAEERQAEELTKQAEQKASTAEAISKSERQKQAGKMASQRPKSEAETRYIIDEQLRQVGWEADTENLRYSKGTRPAKGHNMAIAEWPTNSSVGQSGRVDYALFVDTKLIGVIEAKAIHKDIPSVIDYQGKEYPRNIRKEDSEYQIGEWGEYKVPFTFATNGRPYLKQLETKSGIWFLDLRSPANNPTALHGWISPMGMVELLEKNPQEGNSALKALPYDFLTDPNGLNLREYQLNAIKAAEQSVMLGRATRLCPKIHKTHFEIYDPVGVYDSLNDVNTMKPVVVNPTTSFTQLLDGLSEINDDKQVEQQINQIIAKLQRKKRNMSPKMMDYFISMTDGKDPSQLIMEIEKSDVQEAKNRLLKYRDVFKMLQETKANGSRPVIVSDAEDVLTEHSRGYGNAEKPEDYLNAFSRYIQSNRNEIAALNIICTRPKDLTRKDLKDLRLTLDREGFTTQQLNTALYELTNEEIMADIISLIRRYAIGSTLISHEARIHRAVEKLRKKHNFSKQEQSWISRIEKYLLGESVMNIKVFDEDSRFASYGGFKKINKVFQNNLESIVLELNEYLYDDGGNVA